MLARSFTTTALSVAQALSPAPCSESVLRMGPSTHPVAPTGGLSRRVLLPALLAASSLRPHAALAADQLTTRQAGPFKCSFSAPADWPVTEQELQGSRFLYIAADPADADSANVVLSIQPLAADYSALGSFGTIELVGNTLLPQCRKPGFGAAGPDTGACTLDADGVQGKMLASQSVSGGFGFDYTIEQLGQPMRHLRTLFYVQTEEGRGLRLVTLTAQCYESRYPALKGAYEKVLASFKSEIR